MGEEERREFLACYESQRPIFDNRRVLECKRQDDVTVLRQAFRVFRRKFVEIGNIEVFIESITIPSACNKFVRKRFVQPDTIGLIPIGGCKCNQTIVRRY